MDVIKVTIETGKKRVFAGALDWPGWQRSGRDERAAVQALLDCAPRYAKVMSAGDVAFQPPAGLAELAVTERLAGNASTDFGAPGIIPQADRGRLALDELERLRAILQACWLAFDQALQRAEGRTLQKGPRGGGREVAEIMAHVLDAQAGYLRAMGWKAAPDSRSSTFLKSRTSEEADRQRQSIQDALQAAANGELPERGPRGGVIWPGRYFVRRAAWHVLDHAWEIEDRAV